MMYDGGPPPQGMGLTTIRAWLTELAADYAKAGRAEVHYFEFDRPPPEFGRGSSYHPSLKTHQAMADRLAAAIAKELGWPAPAASAPRAASAPAK
jgi:lysophospholipase L1-like esterase